MTLSLLYSQFMGKGIPGHVPELTEEVDWGWRTLRQKEGENAFSMLKRVNSSFNALKTSFP